jgi:hypothetical protein
MPKCREFIWLFLRCLFGQITFKERIDAANTYSGEAIVFGYISTIFFMFLANVLLINLLIALFRFHIFIFTRKKY